MITIQPCEDLQLAAEELVVRRVLTRHIEVIQREIGLAVLQRMLATVEQGWEGLSQAILNKQVCNGARITDPDDAFMMGKTQFEHYECLCQETLKMSGLVLEDGFSNPLAQARYEQRIAETKLIRLLEPQIELTPFHFFEKPKAMRDVLMELILGALIDSANIVRMDALLVTIATAKGLAREAHAA